MPQKERNMYRKFYEIQFPINIFLSFFHCSAERAFHPSCFAHGRKLNRTKNFIVIIHCEEYLTSKPKIATVNSIYLPAALMFDWRARHYRRARLQYHSDAALSITIHIAFLHYAINFLLLRSE